MDNMLARLSRILYCPTLAEEDIKEKANAILGIFEAEKLEEKKAMVKLAPDQTLPQDPYKPVNGGKFWYIRESKAYCGAQAEMIIPHENPNGSTTVWRKILLDKKSD